MDDPNADLVGYEYVNQIAGGSRWRVIGTDRVLGRSYVESRRVLDGGKLGTHNAHDVRVSTAESMRRRKQLDPTGDAPASFLASSPPCAPFTVAKRDVDREYAAPVVVDDPQLSLEVA